MELQRCTSRLQCAFQSCLVAVLYTCVIYRPYNLPARSSFSEAPTLLFLSLGYLAYIFALVYFGDTCISFQGLIVLTYQNGELLTSESVLCKLQDTFSSVSYPIAGKISSLLDT